MHTVFKTNTQGLKGINLSRSVCINWEWLNLTQLNPQKAI
jgi:hypothetical protein